MIKLYDKNMNYIKSFDSYKDLQVTRELETGYKTVQFSVPYSIGRLCEEMKLNLDNYLYVIKEINMDDEDMYEIYCKPYFGALTGKSIDSLTGYNMTLNSCLDAIVEDTDWKYQMEQQVAGSYTINIQRKSALEALTALKTLYNIDIFYDTQNRTIHVWNKRGQYKEVFFFNETKIRSCKVQSNTYDLVTRLIPIGKNGITLQLVNNNCLWIENYDYTKEVITGYYVNSSIENADDLLKTAQFKLQTVSQPQTAYKIKLNEFISTLEVGDEIRIVDEIKGIDRILRIKKIVDFPFSQEDSYLEVGDTMVSFDDIYKNYTDAQKIVNEDVLRNLGEINKLY